METGMILVAAGYGSFREDCNIPVPKIIEQVCKIPMIAYPLRIAQEIGITKIAVVLNPRDAEVVVRAVEHSIRAGVLTGMPEVVIQPTRAGSAGAVLCALPALRRAGVARAIVTYGDMPMWSARTFRELTYADVPEAAATMVTVQRDARFRELDRYGRVVRKPDRSIERVVEIDDPLITERERAIMRVNPSLWIWDLAWLEHAVSGVEPVRKSDGFGDERHMPPLIGKAVQEGRPVRELALSPSRSREALGVNTPHELRRVQRFRI